MYDIYVAGHNHITTHLSGSCENNVPSLRAGPNQKLNKSTLLPSGPISIIHPDQIRRQNTVRTEPTPTPKTQKPKPESEGRSRHKYFIGRKIFERKNITWPPRQTSDPHKVAEDVYNLPKRYFGNHVLIQRKGPA
ncbi:hypothetical protein GWI33_003519 [Rhynchophorus ferrugineus]|uniref:Uncharacterized protein n=1 Tax=Rhynchophorus ferrugineus TaxID=354439 RepID=A0A834M148_RHYFE|nr:hypothetical protein GWI33_003519 [Rhynchophorus ferrugineus]